MKLIILLLLTSVQSQAACLITLRNQADHGNPILLQTHMISSVVQEAHQEVWVSTINGERFRVTERVSEIQEKIKTCK